MKRMKVMGVALFAILAMSAIASSTAFAGVEIGRCEAQAGGKYENAGCSVKKSGGFEFHKGAAGKTGIKASSGEAVLEGAGGINVVCKASTTIGKYHEAAGKINSVEKVVSTFTGCTLPAFNLECNTKGGTTPGEIVTHELKGKLGYLAGEKTSTPTLGVQLEPSNKKAFAEFECGGGAVTIVTESEKGHNCIISELTPPNTMGLTLKQEFETTGGGHQKYTHFQKTPTKTCQLESSVNGGAKELSGQVLHATIENEIPLEVHG